MSGNSPGDDFHGVHVTKGSTKDQVKALAGQSPEDLLGVSAFCYQFKIGSVNAIHIVLTGS